MAITLTIELTDAEASKLLEIAQSINPSYTPAQVKAWAEQQAKEGLRDRVKHKMIWHHEQSMASAWVDPNQPSFEPAPIPEGFGEGALPPT